MGSVTGNVLKLSVFGESHGAGIGAVIDGFPSGIRIDDDYVAEQMKRRSASGNPLATPRKEPDLVEVLSGVFNGFSEGTPICGLIRNTSTRSGDYSELAVKPRPGHADYTAGIRYGGFQDYRGGGHFSGRLTAPLVFAGALARLALKQLYPGVQIGSRIVSAAGVHDPSVIDDYETLTFENPAFPVADSDCGEAMRAEIIEAMREKDSAGGVIEGYVTGLPAGLGDPMFGSVESRLASMLFSVPAVKGVEFGIGFAFADLRGSEANDPFYMENGKVKTKSNNNGGINGGITNGMPVVYRCAVKPTPSVAVEQDTVNLKTGTDEKLVIHGRHDPCIIVRACPVIEAVTAFVLLDMLLESRVC
ncbi:MAG: chorismate synthase [Eubacteriaceae bacterium]|jgi:chorismate synthase